MAEVSLVKLSLEECHWILLLIKWTACMKIQGFINATHDYWDDGI